ncbi:MAG: cell division control protein Cdc6 [Euryarchaeota archaeon]|nr:cell division control protein Cdc6 [Euryarchaeota archaeon]|tara:strand:- start:536 stop:1783 length:1248 start_codon:yes stop_codon:yes gene_type:complete
MSSNLFDGLLELKSLFKDRRALGHAFNPENLPHRTEEITSLVNNLVEALRGHAPSNMNLYGRPGSGKTAVTRFVCRDLESKGAAEGCNIRAVEINCRNVDTKYRVLAEIGNRLGEEDDETIPFTGWPADKVFDHVRARMQARGGVHVIVLDEIDHLVRKGKEGDDLLYSLTSLNIGLLDGAFCCVIGISNDLAFTEMLDPRVQSRLSPIDVVFPPYNASQLEDVLRPRAAQGIKNEALDEAVIPLCAALAAKEDGDARRALDLLRISVQRAEQSEVERVGISHVRQAQNQLEFDQITPTIQNLPLQQKLVLFSIIINEKNGLTNISTGEVYGTYEMACEHAGEKPLTSRRVSSLIRGLDMAGIITAKKTSRGRHGMSKRINSCLPPAFDALHVMNSSEPVMNDVIGARYRLQNRL